MDFLTCLFRGARQGETAWLLSLQRVANVAPEFVSLCLQLELLSFCVYCLIQLRRCYIFFYFLVFSEPFGLRLLLKQGREWA